MMHFAESSRRQTPRLAILSLVVTVVAWSLPSHAFDVGGNDDKQAKKCPSGKAWNEQKKCITLYKQALDVDPENVDTSEYRRRICDRGTTRPGTA